MLFSLSLTAKAQIKTDEYKDYKPCSECFEKWHTSTVTGNTTVKNEVASQSKNGVRRIGAFVGSLVVATIGVIIYKKVDETVNQVH